MEFIQKDIKANFNGNYVQSKTDSKQNRISYGRLNKAENQDTFNNETYKQILDEQRKREKRDRFLSYFMAATSLLCVGFIGWPVISRFLQTKKFDTKSLEKMVNPEYRKATQGHLMAGNVQAAEQVIQLDKIVTQSHPPIDIKRAMKILDEDMVGMDDVKTELKRLLVQMNYNFEHGIKSDAPLVLCLDGPPGTGKTTIARAFARAMDVPFHKIEMGGAYGASKLRGTEGQYKNACAGEIARAQINHGSKRIVYCLDEAEKAAKSTEHGDPHSALASLTDNSGRFGDDFLQVSLDTTDSIFIMTTNDVEKLPEYIRNRARIIRVAPYDADIKAQIGLRKLSRLFKKTRLENSVYLETNGDRSAMKELVSYTTDQGGRQTEKIINESLIPAIELATKGERKGNAVFLRNKSNPSELIIVAKLNDEGKIIVDSDFVKRWLGEGSNDLWTKVMVNG